MKNDRIVEISNYLQEKYNCKKCGQSLNPEDVNIRETQFSNGKIQFGADCPDCNTFIRWMPTNIIGRVWWKGAMEEIGSFDTNTLQWMLRVNYGKSDVIRKNINKVLMERVDVEPIKDFKPNVKEEKLLKQIVDTEKDRDKASEDYHHKRNELVNKSHSWSYYETNKCKKIVVALWRKLTKKESELDKIKSLLKDIKKGS